MSSSQRRKSQQEKENESTHFSQSYVFAFLIAFRILNALSVRTFFQPDEYFQSLEPARALAFGEDSGAWITWEWRHQLRSAIHPVIFAAVYKIASWLAAILQLSQPNRAELLVAAPKALQALIAATGDFYTWELAGLTYGQNDRRAWATVNNLLFMSSLAMVLLHPFCLSILLGTLATVLRPTNVLVWFFVASVSLVRTGSSDRRKLLNFAFSIGPLVLGFSTLVDRLFYGFWTFPPYRFLYFNLSQNLAVFYGSNPWHYYVSQGIPLLLTTYLPFFFAGAWEIVIGSRDRHSSLHVPPILFHMTAFVVSALSLVSHKEVRFIYPLLPAIHLVSAGPFSRFLFGSSCRRTVVTVLLCCNICIAGYATFVHQSGVISVMDYLRNEYEHRPVDSSNMTVGFLMPCHSTPWRSHLVHPGIDAWALGCEPPVDMDAHDRANYMDEADMFYEDPTAYFGTLLPANPARASSANSTGKRFLPEYIVIFSQLEDVLSQYFREEGPNDNRYQECARFFNSHAHDDWRRKGDVVVYCATQYRRATAAS
ncbi:MAG: glycosylphosphatidylinositol anchor biosynthesis [Vezdaea acicularis]|nr:MAG: glycosylphosphatidylinositol anchor biosynthesis [Vezdaea acicularis]